MLPHGASYRGRALSSTSSEQELHVLGCKLLHGNFVSIYRALDQVRLLLLQHDDPTLDTILDTEAGNDTRAFLADAVATIGRLPFGSRVPPSTKLSVNRELGAAERS